MSLPAFYPSLSFVFLESSLPERCRGLPADLPQRIWREAIASSSVKNAFEIPFDVEKSRSTVLRSQTAAIPVASVVETSYKANAAAFEKAADAEIFYNELDQLLAREKAQHALRETASLNESGKVRVVGFQF